jgi:hypothetical protein
MSCKGYDFAKMERAYLGTQQQQKIVGTLIKLKRRLQASSFLKLSYD